MLTTELQEISYLGEEISSDRRRMMTNRESLGYLEDTRRSSRSLSRDATIGTWNLRTMFQSGKAAQIAVAMQRYSIALL